MDESHDSDIITKRQRLDSSVTTGDLPNPNGEGFSKTVQFAHDVVYRLYFKGLVSDVAVAESGERTVAAGFGVAICDGADNLLYEMKESLSDGEVKSRGVEIRALLHGLTEAFNMGMRRVRIHCDDYPIFQFINGGDKPTQNKMRQLVNEVRRLKEKMDYCEPLMVARNDVKFALKLAREAIVSQSSSVDSKAEPGETCAICLEETDTERMFLTDICRHRHCFSCVKQFVEVKLLSGIVPTCLGEGCKLELTLESCSKILAPRVIEMWKQKMKEDSIPAADRIYCPYLNCSMLMSKSELSSSDDLDKSNFRRCLKCHGLFCIDCKVPSHTDLSCADYKKLHPDPLVDDMKLKFLANVNRWRQCIKCRHLIELSQGCNHMTCRCGYEFCYHCGTEWNKNKRNCPSRCLRTDGDDDDDVVDDDDDDEEDEDDEDDDDNEGGDHDDDEDDASDDGVNDDDDDDASDDDEEDEDEDEDDEDDDEDDDDNEGGDHDDDGYHDDDDDASDDGVNDDDDDGDASDDDDDGDDDDDDDDDDSYE